MECPRPAKISETQLDEIRRLEERMGVVLVAYEKIPPYKKLTPEALKKLQSLEKDTRSILVAYEG